MRLLSPKYNIGFKFIYAVTGLHKLHMSLITTDAWLSFNYAQQILNGPFLEGEAIIAKCPDYAFNYARRILRGRFKLGEPAMAASSYYSYHYALYVLKDRFELGEPAIRSNSNFSKMYDNFLFILVSELITKN